MRRGSVRGLNFGRRRKKINVPLLKEIGAWVIEIAIVLVISFVFVYFISRHPNDTLYIIMRLFISIWKKYNNIICFWFLQFINKTINQNLFSVLYLRVHGLSYHSGPKSDKIQIKNGAVYVNGELFDEKVDTAAIEDAGMASEEITVGEDEYFVLGDNRNRSEDSRYANIGNVKREYIIGKAWFRISPLRKIDFIK